MPTFNVGQILTAAEMNAVAGDSTWQAVAGGVGFQNSWSQVSGNPVAYRLLGHMVLLRGQVTGGASSSIAFTIPSPYQPVNTMAFSTVNQTSGGSCKVTIDTSGNVKIYASASNVQLDGIVFTID